MSRNWYNPFSWFASEKKRGAQPREEGVVYHDVRRFDAAVTDRLNASHWVFSHSESINADLFTDLDRLQSRCSWEAANNALVHGAIETLTTDIFGEEGPTLRVQSDDKSFNEAVERLWQEVWEMPDPNGQLSGVECGHAWIRSLCTMGSFVNVFANVDRAPGSVRFGWTSVSPRRMGNPPQYTGDPMTAFGKRVNKSGKPIEYYIAKTSRFGVGQFDPNEFETFPADKVQHRYISLEPEQLTGMPWLTPCLNTVADLRDLDHYVMQAAKLAAIQSRGLETADPVSAIDPPDLTGTTLKWEANEINIAPKGWKWASYASTQPSAQYTPFRHERLRELGMALGMPLMMVLLSSADSNFASAHYDGAVYMRRVRAIQKWIAMQTLKPMLMQVIREAALMGLVRMPSSYKIGWAWPVPPYVNPEKQAKANRIALEDGTTSPQQVILSHGDDPDAVLAERTQWMQDLTSAGLPLGPDHRNTANGQVQPDDSDEDNQTPQRKRFEIDADQLANT